MARGRPAAGGGRAPDPGDQEDCGLFATLTGDSAGFDAVSLRIGSIWGPLGLPDSPFFALPRLLSAAVWGEDPDLTPPRPRTPRTAETSAT